MNNQHQGILRIPAKQQYAYIEIEVAGTANEIVDTYFQFTKLMNQKNEQFEKNEPPFYS